MKNAPIKREEGRKTATRGKKRPPPARRRPAPPFDEKAFKENCLRLARAAAKVSPDAPYFPFGPPIVDEG